ncbi:UNVERIFIED_CONTAM: hypothetical protein Sradi_3478300 [Sesamum radiatum]|uniref:Uncharacterized protein n=1 Tax=Sesamum radiatum TaxID=300843 RepID=A0AAW2QE60_SESRA
MCDPPHEHSTDTLTPPPSPPRGERLRKEKIAVVAVHKRLLSGPPPHRHEEELQHCLVFHEIGA